jgi:DNA mismatch repair protein MutS
MAAVPNATGEVDGWSPVRRQYERMKAQIPDGILLFRMGDFYETFGDDAEVTARELNIVLTSREMGRGHRMQMAGVPVAALEGHLAKLISAGHRVAVCEQMSDPRTTKGLLDREIVRVVTPGTVVEQGLLPGSANNFLAATITKDGRSGLAYIDITTSEFITLELDSADLEQEIARVGPAEILVAAAGPSDEDGSQTRTSKISGEGPHITLVEQVLFDISTARRRLLSQFGTSDLGAFGCEELPLATAAAGAVVAYLEATQSSSLSQVQTLATRNSDAAMQLDAPTMRTLEVFESLLAGQREGSLIRHLDATQTPMGSRMLRRWLAEPSLKLGEVMARLDAVEGLHEAALLRSRIRRTLKAVPDLERLVNRARSGLASPRDLNGLRHGLEALQSLSDEIGAAVVPPAGHPLTWARDGIGDHAELTALLTAAITDEPAATLGEGTVVRAGFSEELDRLRSASTGAREAIARMEAEEREKTGIPSLKVGYSRVFGYYIEVTRSHLSRVPDEYIRKQTVANSERFFTPALKELEEVVADAQGRTAELEAAIFRQICSQAGDNADRVIASARVVARLDVLAGFAEVASVQNYVRPFVDEGTQIEIRNGRHPVVEALSDEPFVPNDTTLGGDAAIAIVTGPNMAGKSTYLRQVALAVLMAQVGCFVAADEARIGIVDRIFTRAGLQDDITTGRSTFMVEMSEVAYILHQATARSLVILDEIGRGTSTYDGMAIAWAVVEQLHNDPRLGSRTLFATHYHELVELGEQLPRVTNFHVAAAEEEGRVVFLRRVLPGGADRSYGIHVAQVAGLPKSVVARAREVLARLEEAPLTGTSPPGVGTGQQPMLFEVSTGDGARDGHRSLVDDAVLAADPDEMTPLEALAKLYELKKLAEGPST